MSDHSEETSLDGLEEIALKNPLMAEVLEQPLIVGEPFVILFDRNQIKRLGIPESAKNHILSNMGKPHSQARSLTYLTAESEPRDFSGHGLLFSFMFYPRRDEILYACKSEWRS